MSRRSYEKAENTLDKRGFICRNLYSSEFDNPYKINNNLSTLSSVGNKIISRFIKENEKREEKYRQKEKEYYEYLSSKGDQKYITYIECIFTPKEPLSFIRSTVASISASPSPGRPIIICVTKGMP